MTLLYKIVLIAVALLSHIAQSGENRPATGDEIGIKIMGSIVSEKRKVVLTKEINSGKVIAYRIGLLIQGKYKILDIKQEYITVLKGNTKLDVYLDKFGKKVRKKIKKRSINRIANSYSEDGFERKNNKVKMTSMYRDKLVAQDLPKILMQATALPYMENGAIVGFQISQIDEDSIYNKAGIRNMDIITNINGTDLNSAAGAITLLKSLKSADAIDLTIRRNGQEEEITINVD